MRLSLRDTLTAARNTVTAALMLTFVPFPGKTQTFTNPIVAHAADPSVVLVSGRYYSVQSGCPHASHGLPSICIRSAETLPGLGHAPPVNVWTAPASGPNSGEIWAPQIRFLGGRWYIYYAASSSPGLNDHRLFALVPESPGHPLEPWVMASTGAPDGELPTNWRSVWAIDPDVFPASDGAYYLLYSCRQDNSGTPPGKAQSICLSAMTDPLHVTGQTVELSRPTQPWETRGWPTEEGPFGFTHDGVDYILFSGSFSGNPDEYSEGLLINDHPPQVNGLGNPLMNPSSWIKEGPVFDGHHAAYGTGSSVLVDSPDGTEVWNVYHGTDCLTGCTRVDGKTWRDRSDRAQKAGWSPSGSLVMGYPVDILNTDGTGEDVPLAMPSIDGSGTKIVPAWGVAFGDTAEDDLTDGQPVGTWSSPGPSEISSLSFDPNQVDRKFFGANPNWQNYVLTTKVRLTAAGTGAPHARYGVYAAYVDHNNYFVAMIDPAACGATGCVTTDAIVNGKNEGPKNCALPTGFDPAKTNTLAVEAVDGMFIVMVNEITLSGGCQGRQYALTGGQDPIRGSSGQVGAITENAKAQFTSFNVSPGVPLDSSHYPQIYAFRNRASRMNLSNSCDGGCGRKSTNGVAAIQYPAAAPYPLTTSATELWMLHEKGRGTFEIVSAMSGKCLEDPFGNATPSRALPQAKGTSTMLWQSGCNGSSEQRWQFIPTSDSSSFIIQNEASRLVLDCYDTSQGTQMWVTARTNRASQRWQLIIQ